MPPTLHPANSPIRAALGVAILVFGLGATADGSPRRRAARAAVPICPAAGRAEITVPDGIDGIRVIVDRADPDAATDVTVLAGTSDRTIRAFGTGVFGLALDEPLQATRILVALEPVLDARIGACVSRIELLRGGAVVGTAQIK